MSEECVFDFEDPELPYNPAKYEPGGVYGPKRQSQNGDEEMPDYQEVPNSSGNGGDYSVDQPGKQNTSSSDWDSKTPSTGLKYPNLQVTQSMLRPQALRKERISAVDCFQ